MCKSDRYREILRGLAGWGEFLMRESNPPGPRANPELVGSVADVDSHQVPGTSESAWHLGAT